MKENGHVSCILYYYIPGTKTNLVISGWSTGKIRVNGVTDGKAVCEIDVNNGIAGFLLLLIKFVLQ